MDSVRVLTFLLPDLSSVTTTTRDRKADTLNHIWDSVKGTKHKKDLKVLSHLDSKRIYLPSTTLGSVDETLLIFRLTFVK